MPEKEAQRRDSMMTYCSRFRSEDLIPDITMSLPGVTEITQTGPHGSDPAAIGVAQSVGENPRKTPGAASVLTKTNQRWMELKLVSQREMFQRSEECGGCWFREPTRQTLQKKQKNASEYGGMSQKLGLKIKIRNIA